MSDTSAESGIQPVLPWNLLLHKQINLPSPAKDKRHDGA